MNLREREVTIQAMLDESNHQPKESGKHRVLTQWRAKLAKEPYNLQLYQIDEMVREYRNRLTSAALQSNSGSPAPPTQAISAAAPHAVDQCAVN